MPNLICRILGHNVWDKDYTTRSITCLRCGLCFCPQHHTHNWKGRAHLCCQSVDYDCECGEMKSEGERDF